MFQIFVLSVASRRCAGIVVASKFHDRFGFEVYVWGRERTPLLAD